MPKVNGYELTRLLRSQGCMAPIIGATANAMLGEEELSAAYGIRKALNNLGTISFTDTIIQNMSKTKSNKDFVSMILKNYVIK